MNDDGDVQRMENYDGDCNPDAVSVRVVSTITRYTLANEGHSQLR